MPDRRTPPLEIEPDPVIERFAEEMRRAGRASELEALKEERDRGGL